MALLTLQSINALAGTQINFAAASAGGDQVPSPGPNTFLYVKNGSGSAVTVTVAVANQAFNGATIPGTAVSVAAGTDKIIPIPSGYADSNNRASVTYSAATSVTVAAINHT